ncbi:MAG: divergent PAP2 family protein [Rickettsiales bacterium]|jgi:uncharacterized protein|nr:divergent PAP2 family protein [Rickettsiales bacterium]
MVYLILPILAYLAAGSLKFLINSIKAKSLNFKAIGLGGIPSTHNTITSSMLFYIALSEGFTSNFGIMFVVATIIAIDSMDTRNKIGKQAVALKEIFPDNQKIQNLREKTGHNMIEVIAGYGLGFALAGTLYIIKANM